MGPRRLQTSERVGRSDAKDPTTPAKALGSAQKQKATASACAGKRVALDIYYWCRFLEPSAILARTLTKAAMRLEGPDASFGATSRFSHPRRLWSPTWSAGFTSDVTTESGPVVTRPVEMNAFEFVVVSGLRTAQLQRGCQPRVEPSPKTAVTAQHEVAERKVLPVRMEGAL